MARTATERSKKYRDNLKKNKTKHNELKKKDRQRKTRTQASITNKQKDEYRRNHREAQQRYREKLKSEIMNQLPPK
jgi:hypothetical protein